jgi:hypothetical protein
MLVLGLGVAIAPVRSVQAQSARDASEAHARLKPLIGSWEVVIQVWIEPDATPVESKCSSENTWVLDGHFLRQDVQGELHGRPFNGIGMWGFDTFKDKYTAVWFDSISTAIQMRLGDCDTTGKVFTLSGPYDNPRTRRSETARTVLRILNDNEHVSETFVRAADGREFKAGQSTYRRRGTAAEGEPALAGELVYSESSGQRAIKNAVTISPRGHVTVADVMGRQRAMAFSKEQMSELLEKLKDWKDWKIDPLKNPPIVYEGTSYSVSYGGKTLGWHDRTADVPEKLKELAEWIRAAIAKSTPSPKKIER